VLLLLAHLHTASTLALAVEVPGLHENTLLTLHDVGSAVLEGLTHSSGSQNPLLPYLFVDR
jgi:hypothetical protein